MRGTLVFITHTIPPAVLEEWVKKVEARSRQRVDWHLVGGHACIRALGDIAAVKGAMVELMAEHDELYGEHAKVLDDAHVASHCHPPRPEWWFTSFAQDA